MSQSVIRTPPWKPAFLPGWNASRTDRGLLLSSHGGWTARSWWTTRGASKMTCPFSTSSRRCRTTVKDFPAYRRTRWSRTATVLMSGVWTFIVSYTTVVLTLQSIFKRSIQLFKSDFIIDLYRRKNVVKNRSSRLSLHVNNFANKKHYRVCSWKNVEFL